MARGLMRWPALFGIGILAGGVALYRAGPSPERAPTMTPLVHLRSLFDSVWRVERTIDSLDLLAEGPGRILAGASRGHGLGLVTIDSVGRYHAIPAADSTGIDSAWARLPSRDTAVSVLVRLGVNLEALPSLPLDRGRTVCVSTPGSIAREYGSDWDGALGKCGFYAAFGPPAPSIQAWLRRSDIGRETTSPGWRPVVDTSYWVATSRRAWMEDSWSLRLVRAGLPVAYYDAAASRLLTKCAGGVPSTCRAAMLEPIPKRGRYPYWWSEGAGGLGPLSVSVLPDLVRQFGPDRFRAFWRSDADVPTAFEQAFGVSMDAWVQREVVEYYGPLELGAGPVGHAAVSALLWALVFLGLTALMARRLRY